MAKIQINLVNPQELLTIPGIDQAKADLILRHRADHGPIGDAAELAIVVGPGLAPAALERIDFAPAGESATESAGG
jgi:DNA uptake protein ComE-like DNA-binding protein